MGEGYQTFEEVFRAIEDDPQNAAYTAAGIAPLYAAAADARILVVGQAPGRVAQETRIPWNDQSGDRLREWMGVGRETFYDPRLVAIMPMDFYFPGKGPSGDLPPRRGFAERWHPILRGMMPNIHLTILVGTYAVHSYLGLAQSVPLTGVVRRYGDFGPDYFPLAHPSPRNQLWLRRNPWFETEVLPALRQAVSAALA